jgi:hypothetical protein
MYCYLKNSKIFIVSHINFHHIQSILLSLLYYAFFSFNHITYNMWTLTIFLINLYVILSILFFLDK